MDRVLLANICYILASLNLTSKITIKFVYAASEYVEPSLQGQFISQSGPILPEFSGGISDPSLPSVIFAGVGYEYDRTLGVIEYLESASVKAFVPYGVDERFDKRVTKLNEDIFQFIGNDNTIFYDLNKPALLFEEMETLCYGVLKWGRPVFVPLGPKPFSLVSLWLSLIYDGEPVVWRISDGQNETPYDHKPSGKLIECNFLLSPLNV